MTLETCIDIADAAILANEYGIHRLEVCSSLELEGLTPSLELVKKCTSLSPIESHCMIRPISGGFHYTNDTIELMLIQIEKMANLGAKGVVFGCLTEEKNVHLEHNQLLIDKAKENNLEVTFHRAFDELNNPLETLEILIQMGFDRLLTSGHKETAIQGIALIEELTKQSNGRIQIMAGSGVNASNAKELASKGIDALHFSIHHKKDVSSINAKSKVNEHKLAAMSQLFNE